MSSEVVPQGGRLPFRLPARRYGTVEGRRAAARCPEYDGLVSRLNLATDEETWIFGYGSLVWRPSFPHAERQRAILKGYARRFWQGSTDHRGVPEAPGRVVTLIAEASARCVGVAYRVEPGDRDEVLAALDHREKGGYARHVVSLELPEAQRVVDGALVFIAEP